MTRLRVLIVDDEANIRTVLRATLELSGIDVIQAGDGREALVKLEAQDVDAMLLDLNMPTMSGMALLKHLQPLHKTPPVIVLTAHGSVSVALEAMRLGAVDFLEKPPTPGLLREAVAAAVEDAGRLPAPLLEHGQTPAPAGLASTLAQARTALQAGDPCKAEHVLLSAIDTHSGATASTLELLGEIYETRANPRLARRCFVRALQANPASNIAAVGLRRLNSFFARNSSAAMEFQSAGHSANRGAL